jgi:hypothetical protein
MPHDLGRFVQAQLVVHASALAELRHGRKTGHRRDASSAKVAWIDAPPGRSRAVLVQGARERRERDGQEPQVGAARRNGYLTAIWPCIHGWIAQR